MAKKISNNPTCCFLRTLRILGIITLVSTFLLSGCGFMHPVPLSDYEKLAEVSEVKENLFDGQEVVDGPIDLYEAMARAVKYNLDYRLRIMDEAISQGQYGVSKFSMLPQLTANAGYNNRNNIDASVSKSVLTGNESLEASTSRDKHYNTGDFSMAWNILDFGVSYFHAKQEADKYLITMERRRKALHNLIRDVRFAYWRAVAIQQLQGDIKKILAESEQAMEYSRIVEKEHLKPALEILQYQKTLLEVTLHLEALMKELVLAKVELAQLMNLQSGTSFDLVVPAYDTLHVPKLKYNLTVFEELALMNRPELMEASYQKRISVNETKKSIARLFPGVTFRLSGQYDSNSYLVNNSWIESGVQFSWNLINLIAGPKQIELAENKEEATKLQQMTLSMAVLSQVNIAFLQYQGFIIQFDRNSELDDINSRILAQMRKTRQATTQSQVEEIKATTNAMMSKLQRYQTYAHMQNAFGRVYAAAGVDPLVYTLENYDIASLKMAFESTMADWDEEIHPPTVEEKVRPLLPNSRQDNAAELKQDVSMELK